jgi:hypothetical protein
LRGREPKADKVAKVKVSEAESKKQANVLRVVVRVSFELERDN